MSFEHVTERLRAELERIEAATRAAGRPPGAVRLLAASKKHPPEAIRAAYEAGQRDFGENYVQELVDKAEALADLSDIRWHLIGHLQTNKAKYVAPFVASVQSVDSEKLARELGARARARRPPERGPLEVLVEVNVGGESQKSGVTPERLGEVLDAVDAEEGLTLRGLMTIPPPVEDPEDARVFFERLVQLQSAHGGDARLPELSMGMSHDAHVAIRAGATWVRIGTAIFGAR